MNGTVLLVVHSRRSDPGQVAAALQAQGWGIDVRCPRAGESLPASMDDHAGVVIFGGPMSANDDALPFIRQELDWIPTALDTGKPLLGICLGAQLLARCLGAAVTVHPEGLHEVGYYPIAPTPAGGDVFPEPLHVFHWHGEGVALPAGAELLATNDTFANQAFRYGAAAYGVQFHPEIQEDILKLWMKRAGDKLGALGARPSEDHLAGHARHGAAMHRWLDGFVGAWLGNSD